MEFRLEEKRRFPRIKLLAPLHYQIRGASEFNNVPTEDISIGGVSFTNDKFIAPSTHIMLEINILSRMLSSIGRVAWSMPLSHSDRYRVGVEFLELESKEKDFLTEYIAIQTNEL